MYFLPPFIGFFLILFGFSCKEYVPGILGGLFLFLYGVELVINPLPVFSSLMNLIIASVNFGFGAYVWIRGSIEAIREV